MIEIRELTPEDVEALIACLKRTGGETDNLTFGSEGLPVTVEQEKEHLEQMRRAEKSVHYGVWKDGELVANGSLNGLPRRMSHDEYPRRCIRQIEGWEKEKNDILKDGKITHERSREYASYIMEAMVTNVPYKIGGNVINEGLISNLPADACVDCIKHCTFSYIW